MKKIIFSISVLLFACAINWVKAQSNLPNDNNSFPSPSGIFLPIPAVPSYNVNPYLPDFNYTRSWVPRIPMTTLSGPWVQKTAMSTTYKNGFGASLQSITHGGLGQSDIISLNDLTPSLTKYSYIPYADVSKSTKFRMDGFIDHNNFNSNLYPYETGYHFSSSTLQVSNAIRYHHSYSPGRSFVGVSSGSVSYETFNDIYEPEEEVYMWNNMGPYGTPEVYNSYSSDQLVVQHGTADKHDPHVMNFYDKEGRLLCKKVDDGTQWLTTYYLYDDLGRIIWIVPPKAVPASISTLPYSLSSAVTDSLCYHYMYDKYSNVIEKRSPDRGGIEKTVYDRFNRPVMYQNGILQQQNKWSYTIYDAQNRVIFSGLFQDINSNSRTYWQARVLESSGSPSSSEPIINFLRHGVTATQVVPSSIINCQMDIINYYDNYNLLPAAMQGRLFKLYTSDYINSTETPFPAVSQHTNGLLVGTKTRVLDPNNNNLWINTVHFYDFEGKLIQSHTLNPWNTVGDWDINATQYNFNGKTVMEITEHNSWSGTNKYRTMVYTSYSYNYLTGNLVDVKQKVDNGIWLPISLYSYDNLNRVKEKVLGNVESQKYTYNIRGQLTGVNQGYVYDFTDSIKHTYGEILNYDHGFAHPRYDGKLAGYKYRGAGETALPRAYGYLYDRAGRLKIGDYYRRRDPNPNAPPPTFPMPDWHKGTDYTAHNMHYDKNGNMTSLSQKAMAFSGGFFSAVDMDILTYNYSPNSNRLYSVSDAVSTNYNLHDFLDGNTSGADYEYDVNGNLKKDLNKGINNIAYSYMDLPVFVNTTSGTISKLYDAAGNLLQKVVVDNVANTTNTERYWGPFVYKNNDLEYLLHEEGRSRYVSATNEFLNDFFVKDHLGNVRTVVHSEVSSGLPNRIYTSFELARSSIEDGIFDPVSPIRETKPLGTPDDLMSGKLNGQNANERIGAALLMHAMAGDRFSLSGYGYYEEEGSNNSYTMPEFMLSSLAESLTGSTGEGGEGGPVSTTINNLLTTNNYSAYDALKQNITDTTNPRCYLNFLVFDENFELLPDYCRITQLNGATNTWHLMEIMNEPVMPINGYTLIYFSNESPKDTWVDNLYITSYKGVLLEETHYYPHGLTIEAGTQGVQPKNEFLHQSKKLQQELGLELYDFHARQYDPQIGRFWGVDPMDQFPSGYTGMGNDPANQIDPTGMLSQNMGGSGAVGGANVSMGDYSNAPPSSFDNSDMMMEFGFKDMIRQHDLHYNQEGESGGGGGGTKTAADNSGDNSNNDLFSRIVSAVADFFGLTPNRGQSAQESIEYINRQRAMAQHNTNIEEGAKKLEYVPLVGTAMAATEMATARGAKETTIATGKFALAAGLEFTPMKFGKYLDNIGTLTFKRYSVYQGFDNAGIVRYVGITSRDVSVRFVEHLNAIGSGKELLRYEAIHNGSVFFRTSARIFEQRLINQYGLGINGGSLLNKVNSIAPRYWWLYGIK